MPEVLPSRHQSPPRSRRTYAAIALFLIVYIGVLAVVLAPRDMIAAETGAIFADSN
jgi:hypothetical protein